MLQRILDGLRNSVRAALRSAIIVTAGTFAGFAAFCFCWAAAFVYILHRVGVVEACLIGAGAFLVLTLVLAIFYFALTRRRGRLAKQPKSAMQIALSDPVTLRTGLEVIKIIGVRRLIPVAAICGVIFGLMARPAARSK